jgi:mannose-6-phosphate isomerase-like protein (cupin superfamily)
MALTNRTTAEHYRWGDVCDGWRLLDTEHLSVIEERMPPGSTEVQHVHAKATQLFYVLEGALTVEVDAARVDLSVGDACDVRPGQSHVARNESSAPVRFLVISSPTTRGDRRPV